MLRITEAEAKGRLSELIRDVAEGHETVFIEKDGEPQAVVISLDEYSRLKEMSEPRENWKQQVDRVRKMISEELGGKALKPTPEEVIRRMREERDEQILGNLR